MHIAISHLALVPLPYIVVVAVVEDTPAVRFIIGPFALVLYFAVGEEELSLAMHHVVFPPTLVIAAVVENVLTFAVFQIVLLLADVLVPVCIFLVHLNQLFFFLESVLPASAKLSVGQ